MPQKGKAKLSSLVDRFPRRSDIIAVLSVAVFVCFSWSILGFFNKLSSFILYFTTAEIAEIFAVMMASAFLESLAAAGLLLCLSLILPSGWLRDGFAVKGFVSIAVYTITALLLQKLMEAYPPAPVLVLLVILPVCAIVGILFLIRAAPKLQRLMLGIQDRILILSFVYIPLGLFSLAVVLYRNLL